MKKGLAVLLVFGLLLMGVTPVLAAGEQVKAALPAQQDEVVRVVVPEGGEVSDSELALTDGEGSLCAVATTAFMLGATLFVAVGSYYAGSKNQSAWDVASKAVADFVVGSTMGRVFGLMCAVL